MMVLEVDPNLVRPGWTPLVLLVLLGIVLFFLGRSMIKQFGKIDVPADHDPATSVADATPRAHRVPNERTPTDSGTARPLPDLRARQDQGDATPPDRR